MGYQYVPRPEPEVGRPCTIQGRKETHLITKISSKRSVRIACKPRWYSGLSARMVEGDVTCDACNKTVDTG